MPIYEYQCQSCGHTLEALQKISDDPLQNCPSCKESQLKKQVSTVAFRLSGSGWYETDFKTGKKKNITGDSQSSGAGTSDSSSARPTSEKSSSATQSA